MSESEERGDLPDPAEAGEGPGLDNGQPYPLPAQVGGLAAGRPLAH